MTLGGSNPTPQVLPVSSTGTNFTFSASSATGNGGAWLSISPKGGECCNTPDNITATMTATTLPAGVYTGQMTFVEYSQQSMSMTVPVILTISDPHVPATIAATSGTPQTATVAKAFADVVGGDREGLLGRSCLRRAGDVRRAHQRRQRDLRLFRKHRDHQQRGHGDFASVHGQPISRANTP